MNPWISYALGFVTPVVVMVVWALIDSRRASSSCDLCFDHSPPTYQIGCASVCRACMDEGIEIVNGDEELAAALGLRSSEAQSA